MTQYIISEAKIMRQMNHPNIVVFRDIIETKNNVYLIMKLIEGQTLTSFMKSLYSENNPDKFELVVASVIR